MDLLDNYIMLGNAIIVQAAKDYQNSLCYLKLYERRVNSKKKLYYQKLNSECRNFFNGNDILIYTNIKGNVLMEILEKEVIECNYNATRLSKNKKFSKNI